MAERAEHDFTFRDAGHLPLPLRALNAVGVLRPAMRRLEPDALCERAQRNTGLDDFGPDEFREGLEVLCEASNREAHNTAFGALAQRGLHTGLLERRLRLIDHAKRHPEIRQEQIRRPIVVLGLPRTGTTLLSLLLDLDPRVRSLKGWEAAHLIPPPTLAEQHIDPRIAQDERNAEQIARLIPPMPAMHPMGAMLATECVSLFALDFRSLLFETQVLAPTYGSWVDKCDMRPAYRIHRLALQALQSTIPTTRWALKTPHHLWALHALREAYPDAQLVWTHRDPRKVVASVASLNQAFYRTYANPTDPVATGSYWAHKLLDGVTRGMAYEDEVRDASWCHHVAYDDLMDDPVEAVRGIYAAGGEPLDELHEARMRTWMATRPQSHFGRHRYDPADFGLSNEGIDAMFAEYIGRYGVKRETRN